MPAEGVGLYLSGWLPQSQRHALGLTSAGDQREALGLTSVGGHLIAQAAVLSKPCATHGVAMVCGLGRLDKVEAILQVRYAMLFNSYSVCSC